MTRFAFLGNGVRAHNIDTSRRALAKMSVVSALILPMVESMMFSDPVRTIWGKSGDRSYGWLPLWRHLADSADVAGRLWDSWCSTAVKRRIAREVHGDEELARGLTQWLAGVHDIGKATPAFAAMVDTLMSRMRDQGFTVDRRVKADAKKAPHATAGQVVLADWLVHRHAWERSDTTALAVVVGGHHGAPPTPVEIGKVLDRPYLLGVDGPWTDARDELLSWMTRRVGVGELLSSRGFELSQPVQVLLTGLVIMADWIASNEEYFPYDFAGLDDSRRLDDAWERLDLPTPWRAVPPNNDNALFAARFAFPTNAKPYPVQAAAVDVARRMSVPGLLIIEAPMGDGKTEAALAAAEILAGRAGVGGVYVALPTRATADAMYARVMAWLQRLPDEDVGRGDHDAALVHGKAFLNTDFSSLFRYGLASAIGIDDGGADISVHRWLNGRKRKMLTNFAIGTIDQVLFAALKSRHVVLRHLGLAGKVVIIDEAHAYDVYMSSYLDRALEWLGAHGAPVVVLSATLPSARRAEMLQAYDDGRLGRPHVPRGEPSADPYQVVRTDRRYPVLTACGEERRPVAVACAPAARETSIRLSRLDDDPAILADTLRASLADGGCALVVCNTVSRVQETARVLREQLGLAVPVSVAHSRFMGPDRAANDRWLLDAFGSPSHLAQAGRMRPDCHVVVASQVAEQSLDVDFDLLVTDLAPVDLVLQRAGRLHRHVRGDRPGQLSQARCLVRGADWQADPPRPASGSIVVYGREALLRSAAVLSEQLDQDRPLKLPRDIPALVQRAYGGGPVGPPTWQGELAAAAEETRRRKTAKLDRAKSFQIGAVNPTDSLIGWLSAAAEEPAGSDDARGRAHVRDDGGENLEVLVLVRCGEQLVTPPWLAEGGGQVVPTHVEPPRGLARVIAACELALPLSMTANAIDQIIAELEARNDVPGWQKDPLLSGQLILDLDEYGRAHVAGFALEYDSNDGLRTRREAAL